VWNTFNPRRQSIYNAEAEVKWATTLFYIPLMQTQTYFSRRYMGLRR